MSEENFTMPCEHQADATLFFANRTRLLDNDGNYSLSLSPDSAHCNFSLSERGHCFSPDINTLSAGGPMLQPSNALSQRNLDNTFITTSDNGSIYLWDNTVSVLSKHDLDEGMNSATVSPSSEATSSCGMSCRGSVDLSFSSGEMMVRSDSFLLEEQAVPLVLSSLEESPAHLVTSHAESQSHLTHTSEYEGEASHAFHGITFVFGDEVQLPSENDTARFNSTFALPGENASARTTFLRENSLAHCADTEMLNESGAPEMLDHPTFDSPMCAVQDKDNRTSFQNHASNNPTLCKTTSEGNNSVVESPDFVRARLCGTSCRNSVNLSCSSGEMVVRSNSLILEDQEVPFVLSSLEESPSLPIASHTKSKLFLTSMCEKDSTGERAESHSRLGMTFVSGDNIELPSIEDVTMCVSSTLPGEKASLSRPTFLCENSPADVANEAQFIHSGTNILNETYVCETPVQAVTFEAPLSTVQHDNICTSTPLQNLGSNMPSLPPFAASPFTENTGSPALQPVVRRRNPVTNKQRELIISSGKVTKMETSQSDLNGLKCKRDAALSSALLDKPSQKNSKHNVHKCGSFRPSPSRNVKGKASPLSKAVQNSQRRQNVEANNNQKTTAHCSPASPSKEQGTLSQTKADLKAHTANATFCYPKKSPQKSDKTAPKPIPKNDMTNKVKLKLDSAVGHDTSASKTPNSYPCTSSETVSRFLKVANTQNCSASFTISKSKTENLKSQRKPAGQDNSSLSRAGDTMEVTDTNCRKVKKIGLVIDPKTVKASCSTDTNSRVHGGLPPCRACPYRAPAARPMTITPVNKQRLGISGRESCRATSTLASPLSKQKPTGCRKATREKSLPAIPTASAKPAPLQRLQTTPRLSLMGPPPTPVPLLQQRKGSCGSARNQNESAAHCDTSETSRTTQVSRLAGRCATPFKVPILKPKLTTTSAKTSAPVLTAPCKSSPTTRGLPNGHISSPKRTTTATLIRLSTPVDKSKPKAGARPQQQQQGERGTSRPQQGTGRTQDVGPGSVTDGRIQRLRAHLIQSNNRFEALTVVLQQTLAQRDEAIQQSRGLSQELLELRGELMHTVNRSEGLALEKEALKASLQEALQQVQAQHHRDLLELEQRLREQHQSETRAAQQQLREEAERSRLRLQIQLEELRAAHETTKQDLETSHSQQLQSVRQQHQLSLQELRDSHAQELQSLNLTLKDAEMVLNEKIRELTQENAALMERITEEEKRSRDMAQKDSHTVYLERELESLNVVLDIKTKQLHQQEKKLMEVDKLNEKNVKLEESLRKVQQENEDLTARMERHAALSRQLSTEQTLLQESLQKESKVNKRLSMENEELLWKLHNGDLSSPRKSSPNPPSPHFSLQSPRASSSLFSSPPVSPR